MSDVNLEHPTPCECGACLYREALEKMRQERAEIRALKARILSTPAASEARDAETANEERDVLGERGLPRARHAGDRHRYERLAAAFYDETGMMAPGKDDPTGHHSYDERWEAWHRWTSERRVRQLAPSSPTPAPAPGEAERDPGYMTPEERAEFNAITRRLTYPVKIVRKEEWERIQSQLAAATRERDSARQVTDDYAAELARWRKIADTRGQHARGLVLRRREAEARAEAAERALAEAREEIRQLRLAGTMLSNVAFNLAQHDERPGQRQWAEWRQSLDDTRRTWDATVEQHVQARAALPPTPTPPEGTPDA